MNRPLRRLIVAALPVALVLPAGAQIQAGVGSAPRLPARPLPAPEQEGKGFEVVGRGPVTWTRSTGLAAFRGGDGRDYVYMGTAGECDGCARGRLYVWDVTDPQRPVLTDSVQLDAAVISDVAVNEAATLAVATREGSSDRRNGLVFLDLSAPAHPRIAGDLWESIVAGAHDPVWSGTSVFVVDAGTDDVVIVDASNPADARPVGRWGIPYASGKELHHVAVDDGLAYLSYGDDGLIVLDVGRGIREGTPQRPRLVTQYRYRTEWRGERWGATHWSVPHTSAAGARLLFLADEILPDRNSLARRSETAGYLHVLDVSNPAGPREVASYAVSGSGIRAMWAQGDTLYLAAHGAGVRALDVSGTLRGNLRGREVAWFPMGGEPSLVPGVPYAWDVTAHNGLVLATDANSGLWVARPVPTDP